MSVEAEQAESVAAVLDAALDDEDPDRNLERVRRVAVGEPASPAPRDYALAMQKTDGAVCIELDTDPNSRILFRWRDGEYERFSEFAGTPAMMDTVASTELLRWFGQYSRSLVLHSDVAQFFENATTADAEAERQFYRGE